MVPGDPGHPVYLKKKKKNQNLTCCFFYLLAFLNGSIGPSPTLFARAMVWYVVCIHWRG